MSSREPSSTLYISSPLQPEVDGKAYHTFKGRIGRSHFTIDPHALAPPPPSSPTLKRGRTNTPKPLPLYSSGVSLEQEQQVPAGASTAIFDSIPRNNTFDTLLPILSRLPIGSSLKEDVDDKTEERFARNRDRDAFEYLQGRQVPYTRSRLPRIDSASLALWTVLHHFRPLTADYAVGYLDQQHNSIPLPPHPIPSGVDAAPSLCPAFTSSRSVISTIRRVFNWHLLPPLPLPLSAEWYGVIFRSARKPRSDSLSFYEADRLAHEEAVNSGGLLMYWYGSPDPNTGENLATCIWTDRAEAIKASRLKRHGEAARYSRSAYTTYDLTRYTVRKVEGEQSLRIEEWSEDKR